MKKQNISEMRKEYDFTRAERGKFYKPLKELEIPIYLDKQIRDYYGKIAATRKINIGKVINRILKKEMEIQKEIGLK